MIIEIHYSWFWIGKFTGLTIFALILVKDKNDLTVIRHEQCHVRQWEADPFLFHIKYLYYLIKYGYRDNPYEIEARKHGTVPTH